MLPQSRKALRTPLLPINTNRYHEKKVFLILVFPTHYRIPKHVFTFDKIISQYKLGRIYTGCF